MWTCLHWVFFILVPPFTFILHLMKHVLWALYQITDGWRDTHRGRCSEYEEIVMLAELLTAHTACSSHGPHMLLEICTCAALAWKTRLWMNGFRIRVHILESVSFSTFFASDSLSCWQFSTCSLSGFERRVTRSTRSSFSNTCLSRCARFTSSYMQRNKTVICRFLYGCSPHIDAGFALEMENQKI